MASKAQRMQHLTIALCDAMVDMVWEQRYSKQDQNKTFKEMMHGIKDVCFEIRIFIRTEPNGSLSANDIKRVGRAIQKMKSEFLPDTKEFTTMMALAIMVDMIIYQLKVVSNHKTEIFTKLLKKVNYMVRYFDRNQLWEDDNDHCLKAAENLREYMEEA